MTRALETMELTSAQGQIMGFLATHPQPPCPRDLEEAFHLSHPTVSGLLSRLEQKGFVELRRDPEDRRCKRIYVLPKGRDCMDQIRKAIETMERRLIRDFDPEEQAAFSSLLDRAIRNLGGEIHRPPEMEETSC